MTEDHHLIDWVLSVCPVIVVGLAAIGGLVGQIWRNSVTRKHQKWGGR